MATVLFDDFLRSMATAVSDTNKYLQESQQDMGHFEETGADGVLRPKTVKMLLPRAHVGPGESLEGVHEVPTATLAHHNHVLMDRLKLDLYCQIDVEAGDRRGGAPKIALTFGGHGVLASQHLARVQVSFRSAEPPEGASRVRDQLLKMI